MSLVIDHLLEHPAEIPRVAAWIHDAFWVGRNGLSRDDLKRLLREANDPGRIPLSLLAMVDGEPAGTVNLIDCDDPKRPHLHPWLAALVVTPEHRGRGVGSALVRRCAAEAARLGFDTLYLGADVPAFYARLGAEVIEPLSDGGAVMKLSVTAVTGGTVRDAGLRPSSG